MIACYSATAQIIVAVGIALALFLVGLGYCMNIAAQAEKKEKHDA